MLKSNRPYCDHCGRKMRRLREDDGEPHGFHWRIAREHVCNECADAAIDQAWKDRDPCGECETEPCKRGRDCWFDPHLPWPYETYFADPMGEKASP